MKCPYCGFLRDRVVDSRESREGDVIRRRRQCLECEKRFTSYEKIESIPFQVVKRDERREPYDREKLMKGLRIACRKRPVPAATLDDIADDIEIMMQESSAREISSLELGNLV
ncbi:MAG: transcriptional regulator NrdR, partial [Thermoanaerobaculia bacterium]|nr:transcriptional regulator NrdR [Thermoanaerobaculia bacterium]